MNPEETYSAMQIARALGCTRQAVFQKLGSTAPDGVLIKDGRQVKAWSFGILPADIRMMLTREAEKRHYRGPEALLGMPPKVWNPPVPLAETADQYIQKAISIQQALRPILARLNASESAAGDLEQQGIQEYQKVLGYAISTRHWRRLLKRTIARDDGAENWDRLELYIDSAVGRKPAAEAMQPVCNDALQYVTSTLSSSADPKNPSHEERALIWYRAFEYLEDEVGEGKKETAVKRLLLDHLLTKAPFLAKNLATLRRTFNRKFQAWSTGRKSVGDIEDKRHERSGRKGIDLHEEDLRAITAHAVNNCGGRISQAVRELITRGELSAELTTHYLNMSQGRSKSYVLPRIRDAVKTDVHILMPHRRGPHAAKMAGAFPERDWSTFAAGDWFQGDDTTLPVYFWNDEALRNPTRGQFLAMIDCRSTMIMGFVLIVDKSYNGRDVRNLMTKTHDVYGLPRKGFFYEGGSWQSAIVKGKEVPWSKTCTGLSGHPFNLRFRQAKEARAKIIERVLGALQNYLEREIGYCGRDERIDCPEDVKKHLQYVRSGREHPSECFYHHDEWVSRLEVICDQYNHERQDGKILQGRSPWQAYQEFYTTPLRRLDASTRYLLANYKFPVKVGRNGITFRFGKEAFTYKNEQTGKLIGRELVAWFSPEQPEILSVTDLEEEIPFTVERAAVIPAMDASEEELQMAQQQNNRHNSYGKRLYRSLRHDFPQDFQDRMFMPSVSNPQKELLGERMEAQRSEAKEKLEERKREENKLVTLAARHRVPISSRPTRRKVQAEALSKLAEFLREDQTPTQEPVLTGAENVKH